MKLPVTIMVEGSCSTMLMAAHAGSDSVDDPDSGTNFKISVNPNPDKPLDYLQLVGVTTINLVVEVATVLRLLPI